MKNVQFLIILVLFGWQSVASAGFYEDVDKEMGLETAKRKPEVRIEKKGEQTSLTTTVTSEARAQQDTLVTSSAKRFGNVTFNTGKGLVEVMGKGTDLIVGAFQKISGTTYHLTQRPFRAGKKEEKK